MNTFRQLKSAFHCYLLTTYLRRLEKVTRKLAFSSIKKILKISFEKIAHCTKHVVQTNLPNRGMIYIF